MLKFILLHKEFLIGLILTLSLFWPLFAAPYFTHHDDVQVIRIYEMGKCFKDHQIPCRWVPDLGGLYGYPIFNYYAPLPYYFGGLIYLLTGSLLFSSKAIFVLSFLGAYIFMFLLASKLWGRMGGAISAIFYSFAPYHALDFYVRGAMGELWGLMFFPGLFWAFVKLEEKTNIKNLLLVAILIFGLISSHNLSAMIFLPIVSIWAIFLFLKRKTVRFLWFGLSSAIIGIMLSAFYLLPATFEKDLVHLETMVGGYFSYTEHFKGIKKLFLERSWEYGSSIREVPGGEKDGLSYQIGWVHLFGWFLAVVTAKILWKKNRTVSVSIIFFSLITLFSVFMIHPRSEFIWKAIDPLKYLQFPWRFLLITIFFVSFLSGSLFKIGFKHRRLVWAALVFAVVILNFAYFRPEKFIQTDDQKLLSGEDWDRQIKRSIFDYLPIYAKEPPAELATSRYEILTGTAKITEYKAGTNWFSFAANIEGRTIIRLSQYYFPNWVILVNGKETNVEYKNNSLGLMTLILGDGNYTVLARLYDTPIRTIANLITLLGFSVSAILFLVSFAKVRGWISYYRKRMN